LKKRNNFRHKAIAFLLAVVIVASLGTIAGKTVVQVLYPMKYSGIISRNCDEFGVDESLVYAVIHTESGFDEYALSEAGAMGLMQIMPDTFQWLQKCMPADSLLDEQELYTPEVNIRYGVYYISRLKGLFGSDTLAIAAYHAGQGSVGGWIEQSGLSAGTFSEKDIPSAATAHYVHKVNNARAVYMRLYF